MAASCTSAADISKGVIIILRNKTYLSLLKSIYYRFHTKESIKTLDIKWVFTYISTFKYLKNGILVHIDLHTLAVSRDP